MTGNEWLNIQDIFSLFLGRWIVVYLAAALAGAVCKTLILALWRRAPQVRMIRSDGDE